MSNSGSQDQITSSSNESNKPQLQQHPHKQPSAQSSIESQSEDSVFQQDSKEEDDMKENKVDSDLTSNRQQQQRSSADSLLSSSLEAEQRLLKQMGWKEEDEGDFYEPLTEDEVREFHDLIIARKSAASNNIMTKNSSKNLRNMFTTANNFSTSCWSGYRNKTGLNSSLLASPQENNSSSSSDDTSSDDDDDDDDENIVPEIRNSCS